MTEPLEFNSRAVEYLGSPRRLICLDFHRESGTIALATTNGLLCLINKLGKKLFFNIYSLNLTYIKFFKNFRLIFGVVAGGASVILVDSEKMAVVARLGLKTEMVTATTFHEVEGIIFLGTNKGNIYIVKIENNNLILNPYCIFWNLSCKGHAHAHPGGIIAAVFLPATSVLLICFLNGILSYWSFDANAPNKVINAFEKFLCSDSVGDDSLIFGCSDSAYIIVNTATGLAARNRLKIDIFNSGVIWKIKCFDQKFKNNILFLCFGGLSDLDDNGEGLTLIFNDKQIMLTKTTVIDAVFYNINENDDKISILVLDENSVDLYIVDLDTSAVEKTNNFFKFPSISDIVDFYSVKINDFSELTQKIIEEKIEKLLGIKEIDINKSFLTFLCHGCCCDVFLCMKNEYFLFDCINFPEKLTRFKYVESSTTAIFFTQNLIYLSKINLENNIEPKTIKIDKDINVSVVEQESYKLELLNFIAPKVIISYPFEQECNIKCTISENFIILFMGVYILKIDEYFNVSPVINIPSTFSAVKNISKSKLMKVFQSESTKHDFFKDMQTGFKIIASKRIIFNSEKILVLIIQTNENFVYSLHMDNKFVIRGYEFLTEFQQPLLYAGLFKLPETSNANKDTQNIMIFLSESLLQIRQRISLKEIAKLSPNSDAKFTECCHYFKNLFLILDTNKNISVFSLDDFSPVFNVKCFHEDIKKAIFFNLGEALHLFISTDTSFSCISLYPDISSSLSASLFSNCDTDSNPQSLKKSLIDLVLQRPTTLSEKINKQKNIVVDAIADVKNHDSIKSELLIVAEERKQKLDKTVQQAEQLKQAASEFENTTKLLLEKAKKGLL